MKRELFRDSSPTEWKPYTRRTENNSVEKKQICILRLRREESGGEGEKIWPTGRLRPEPQEEHRDQLLGVKKKKKKK